jgi:glutathione S-transferase
MQGQANHFSRYAPEHIEYGVKRYVNETRRLYGVLDKHLEKSTSGYLVGDKCTIADIAHWGWVTSAGWAGVDINEFPALKAWDDRMLARPGVEKGRHVPDHHSIKDLLKDPVKMKEHAEKSRVWVQQGMAADAKK